MILGTSDSRSATWTPASVMSSRFFRVPAAVPLDDHRGVAESGPRHLVGETARDEGHHRFRLRAGGIEPGEFLLHDPAGFAEEGDRPGLAVRLEQREQVLKGGADQRVPPDADTGGLAQPLLSQDIGELTRHSAAARHDSHGTLGEGPQRVLHVAAHGSQLGLAGRNESQAVGADDAGAMLTRGVQQGGDVPPGDALGHDDQQADSVLDRFQCGVPDREGRNRNDTGVDAVVAKGVPDTVIDGDAVDLLASLSGRHSGHHPGAVIERLAGEETSFPPRDPLDQNRGAAIDQYSHQMWCPVAVSARSTARAAASSMDTSRPQKGTP